MRLGEIRPLCGLEVKPPRQIYTHPSIYKHGPLDQRLVLEDGRWNSSYSSTVLHSLTSPHGRNDKYCSKVSRLDKNLRQIKSMKKKKSGFRIKCCDCWSGPSIFHLAKNITFLHPLPSWFKSSQSPNCLPWGSAITTSNLSFSPLHHNIYNCKLQKLHPRKNDPGIKKKKITTYIHAH